MGLTAYSAPSTALAQLPQGAGTWGGGAGPPTRDKKQHLVCSETGKPCAVPHRVHQGWGKS